MTTQLKTLVMLMAIGLAVTAVAVVPEASAHTCYSLNPFDCGSCTSGTHEHTYCRSWEIYYLA
jgi:hypothetical protein